MIRRAYKIENWCEENKITYSEYKTMLKNLDIVPIYQKALRGYRDKNIVIENEIHPTSLIAQLDYLVAINIFSGYDWHLSAFGKNEDFILNNFIKYQKIKAFV